MKRRDFITVLGGASAWPTAARVQQPERMRRIAALISGGSGSDLLPRRYAAAFRNGLAKLEWIEGRNLHLDLRFADSNFELVHATAAEMVRLCGFALANAGHDTRSLQAYLGHRNIQHTVRYTELAPDRFKNFWRT